MSLNTQLVWLRQLGVVRPWRRGHPRDALATCGINPPVQIEEERNVLQGKEISITQSMFNPTSSAQRSSLDG